MPLAYPNDTAMHDPEAVAARPGSAHRVALIQALI